MLIALFFISVLSFTYYHDKKYFPIFPDQTHSIPIITSNTSAITCKDEFYELNDTCLPRCDKFKQQSNNISLWMEIVTAWTGFFGFIMSVVVLILSIIRYKSM